MSRQTFAPKLSTMSTAASDIERLVNGLKLRLKSIADVHYRPTWNNAATSSPTHKHFQHLTGTCEKPRASRGPRKTYIQRNKLALLRLSFSRAGQRTFRRMQPNTSATRLRPTKLVTPYVLFVHLPPPSVHVPSILPYTFPTPPPSRLSPSRCRRMALKRLKQALCCARRAWDGL
jgi:hypothetical protein